VASNAETLFRLRDFNIPDQDSRPEHLLGPPRFFVNFINQRKDHQHNRTSMFRNFDYLFNLFFPFPPIRPTANSLNSWMIEQCLQSGRTAPCVYLKFSRV